MDQFEKNFEELDIQSSVMENAIQQSNGQIMPEDKVDDLMRQVCGSSVFPPCFALHFAALPICAGGG